MSIICSGSLAIDKLFNYPGLFSSSFIAANLDIINLSFIVDNASVSFGGTAGNIVYNLSLLEEKPILTASLGDDPDGLEYLERLKNLGLPLDGLTVHKNTMTASCVINTDEKKNQLTFFHPGAMLLPSTYDPATLKEPYKQHLAIVSPGGPAEMIELCKLYRKLGIRYIFDPGQQAHFFKGEDLISMLDGSTMLICNEYEFEIFKEFSGLNLEEIFCHTESIIVTKGANGSELIVPGRGSQHINALPVKKVANPTGSGDAFRAGLLKALCKERPEHLITACRLGATVASFCVETDGGPQKHNFTLPQVAARHASFFKEQISL